MELEKKEGIVVKSINYQESKRIITIFTAEGLLTLMATIYHKQPHSVLLTSPLCIAEFCYKKNSSDLHFLKEGSIISSHLNYNTSYARLESAFELLKVLIDSQLPAKPAPLLYELSKFYLRKLSTVTHPKNLSSSFMLKVLKHEGLFPLEGMCCACDERSAHACFTGEFYCAHCMPKESLFFEPAEWETLQTFLFSKDLKIIDAINPNKSLYLKIETLFQELLRQG